MARYAKSGRSVCRHCMHRIPKGELRVAVVAERLEGVWPPNLMVPWWYHMGCFIAGLEEDHPTVPLRQLHPEHFDGYGSVSSADLEDFRQVGGRAELPRAGRVLLSMRGPLVAAYRWVRVDTNVLVTC